MKIFMTVTTLNADFKKILSTQTTIENMLNLLNDWLMALCHSESEQLALDSRKSVRVIPIYAWQQF